MVHTARMRVRDDLAEMLCKRVASNVKKAKTELEEIRHRQRAVNEHLIGTYRGVLEHLDPTTPDTAAISTRERQCGKPNTGQTEGRCGGVLDNETEERARLPQPLSPPL
ncbi:hypothetical protein [Nocardiopsis tropica]|uniref:Transposase n=1 Tax=Nocardiopsis tropica TaxID=109330 RepID=A0ABU7KUE3_9ACTN|nr:hypothetical protein [Nocardiopsis umidischolae]MEE2052928.1 hypothetical protein [Nocardiopsis umidischolae]